MPSLALILTFGTSDAKSIATSEWSAGFDPHGEHGLPGNQLRDVDLLHPLHDRRRVGRLTLEVDLQREGALALDEAVAELHRRARDVHPEQVGTAESAGRDQFLVGTAGHAADRVADVV